jgi:hypothetical protein
MIEWRRCSAPVSEALLLCVFVLQTLSQPQGALLSQIDSTSQLSAIVSEAPIIVGTSDVDDRQSGSQTMSDIEARETVK